MATKTKSTEVTQETITQKMEQAFAMWKNTSKKGTQYFSGGDGTIKLVGYYNTNKKNPKEPDIRIYQLDAEGKMSKDEYTSLWCNVSKNGKKFLTGKIGDQKIVGFIRENATEKQPYFSCYFSNSEPKKQEAEESQEKLPF